MAAAAILVILIEDVLLARIASGRISLASDLNKESLSETFSDAAYTKKLSNRVA